MENKYIGSEENLTGQVEPTNEEVYRNFNGRIIVVDDDEGTRKILSSALEKAGFSVKAVSTSEELRQALSHRLYDAILLDVYLENDYAPQVLPEVIRDYPYTKVFMMS